MEKEDFADEYLDSQIISITENNRPKREFEKQKSEDDDEKIKEQNRTIDGEPSIHVDLR